MIDPDKFKIGDRVKYDTHPSWNCVVCDLKPHWSRNEVLIERVDNEHRFIIGGRGFRGYVDGDKVSIEILNLKGSIN